MMQAIARGELHVTQNDGEPTVYSYAPHGAVAYDVDTPEGAAAAHRADMMRVADPNEY
jgi:hypothetical protein